jgi:hypothetical protein
MRTYLSTFNLELNHALLLCLILHIILSTLGAMELHRIRLRLTERAKCGERSHRRLHLKEALSADALLAATRAINGRVVQEADGAVLIDDL